MKKFMGVAVIAAAFVAVGCEEKKAEPAKAAEGAAGAIGDAAKKAMTDTKEAGAKAAEAAKDATKQAVDAGKQAIDDAAAKAKTGAIADLKTKVDGLQGKIDGVKTQIAALPEIARKPATDALASIEKKYTDLKASFAGLEKAAGDEFTKLSGQVGTQVTSLTEELGKIIKK